MGVSAGEFAARSDTAGQLAAPTVWQRARADIAAALDNWPVIRILGLNDITMRYRRSVVGQFWITLSNAILIGAIGTVWSLIWKMPIAEFIPYLAVGHVFWLLITGTMADAASCYQASAVYLKEINLPRSTYVFANLAKHLVVLGHNVLIFVPIALIFGIWPGLGVVWFVPGFLLVMASLVGASFWLAMGGLRFRDVASLVQTVFLVLFFLTPVIWKIETLAPEVRHWLILNPFVSLLEILRAPLLGQSAQAVHWMVAAAWAAANLALGWWAFARYRARITYWL